MPFYDENLSNLYSKIIFTELQIPLGVNRQAADLLQKLLNTVAARRPTFEEILSHPWMEIRKLFGKDFHEHDWEIEYSMVRSEANANVLDSIMVAFRG